MKVCATSPLQGEFTLCGDAFDMDETDVGKDEFEPFRFGRPGDRVNCIHCLRAISAIHERYTLNGKIR